MSIVPLSEHGLLQPHGLDDTAHGPDDDGSGEAGLPARGAGPDLPGALFAGGVAIFADHHGLPLVICDKRKKAGSKNVLAWVLYVHYRRQRSGWCTPGRSG